MKKQIFLFILVGLANIQAFSQDPLFAEKEWKQLTSQQYLADFFDGFFVNLGVTVRETNEKISVLHKGDHFEIERGIDSSKVDYIITIGTNNIKNLVAHASDGVIDEAESYEILAVLFTPLTKSTLENPLMTEKLPRFFNKIENNIHVKLHNPDNSKLVAHTLIYVNNEWIVVSGLHGTPKRTFNLSAKEALNYQKHVAQAMKGNTRKDWNNFKKWYLTWRKSVSE